MAMWETALIFWPQNNRTSLPWIKISETVNPNKYFSLWKVTGTPGLWHLEGQTDSMSSRRRWESMCIEFALKNVHLFPNIREHRVLYCNFRGSLEPPRDLQDNCSPHHHPIVGTLLRRNICLCCNHTGVFSTPCSPETISADLLPVFPWGPLKLCSHFDSSLSMVRPQQGLFNFLTLKMMCTGVGLCTWEQGSVEARAGGRSQMLWSWSFRHGESPDMGAGLWTRVLSKSKSHMAFTTEPALQTQLLSFYFFNFLRNLVFYLDSCFWYLWISAAFPTLTK